VIDKSGHVPNDPAYMPHDLEESLRWIATRRHARPPGLLAHAIDDPESDSAARLAPLVATTATMPEATPEKRAMAVWGLIIHTIDKVGATTESRRRNVLLAAFRLPRRQEIHEPWKSTLGDRLGQLMALPGVFGYPLPTTTTPMHQAWKRALHEKLVPMLYERLDNLANDGRAWLPYVEVAESTEAAIADERAAVVEPIDQLTGYRPPSKGAQPVFLDLFVTTVFMKGRAVYRRITERLVTARQDHVDGYTAKALLGAPERSVAVLPLWGCRAEQIAPARAGEPTYTQLRFPRTLRLGEKHYFCSETIARNLLDERVWVNVEVDHHGIAPGRLVHGCVPAGGLTIRISFDPDHLPEACWWYAEQTERERLQKPPDNDPSMLTVVGDTVQHTFTDRCHPHGNYGIALLWPPS
jgi:hypothetical protein